MKIHFKVSDYARVGMIVKAESGKYIIESLNGNEAECRRFNLVDHIKTWVFADAMWYEFWMPNSDFPGGVILGALISIVMYIAIL